MPMIILALRMLVEFIFRNTYVTFFDDPRAKDVIEFLIF